MSGQCGRSVYSALRDDTPDAASRIGTISLVTRDEVEMKVRHRLSGGGADVHTDVPAVRTVLLHKEIAAAVDQIEHGPPLLFRGVEKRGYMAERDDQYMAGGDRESIIARIGKGVFRDDTLRRRIAERAGHMLHPSRTAWK